MEVMSEVGKKLSHALSTTQTRNGPVENETVECTGMCNVASLIIFLDDLYAYALFLTRNRTESEDLVQETYLRAVKSLASLADQNKLKPWLMAILRNVWISQLRKKRVTPIMIEIDNEINMLGPAERMPTDPCEHLLNKAEGEAVRKALQRLPPSSREIIVLREYDDMSYEEIATTLNCPVGTVMSRLARARAKLRTLLRSNVPPTSQR